MSIYLRMLKKAQTDYHGQFYETSVRECGSIVEKGLKELYASLERHLNSKGSGIAWLEMHENFKKNRSVEFEIEVAGLGGILLFARYTKFWDQLRIMCTSNLSFIQMINWHRVRTLRNNSVHNREVFTKAEAMEMLFYTKVFLYDCELIEGMMSPAPEILDADCLNCGGHVNHEWKYCPNCAASIKQSCHNCKRDLHPSHRICPSCDTQRMCRVDLKESTITYKRYSEAVWADWEVTPMERQWLKSKRLELGLSLKEAKDIETSVIPVNYHNFLSLIEAVNIDGVIDEDEKEFLLTKAVIMDIKPDVATKLIDASRKETRRIRKSILGLSF